MVERVIVGVDGSDHSRQALRWAIDEARRRETTLMVVMVAERRSVYASEVADGRVEADLRHAEAELRRILDEVADLTSGLTVRSEIAHGDPRKVLHDRARPADLLVVGSRGHGELAGVVLGSVGQYLVTHAPCPVTVVRSRGT